MRLVVSLKEVLVIPQSFILNYTVISPYTSAKLVFFNWLLAINWFSAITVQHSTTYILCHKFSYKIHWNICHFICINLLSIRLNWFYRIFNLKLFLKFTSIIVYQYYIFIVLPEMGTVIFMMSNYTRFELFLIIFIDHHFYQICMSH